MMYSRKFKVLFSGLFFILLSGIANAAPVDPSAFYVDKDNTSASDTNPGSASRPWKTIQHGVN